MHVCRYGNASYTYGMNILYLNLSYFSYRYLVEKPFWVHVRISTELNEGVLFFSSMHIYELHHLI